MSAQLIIWLPGKPLLNGYKQREFLWSEAHKCYVYQGVEVSAESFNEVYEKAVRNNSDLRPRVRVVGTRAEAAKPAPATAAPLVNVPAPISPREITLEMAEEVMQRLAPDRLKKKTGPKPGVLEVS